MGNRKLNKTYQKSTKANRRYKDRLFRMIFQERRDLLELYNAVNHSSYADERELVVNSLEDAVYLGMKNDLSFLVGGTMNLYEEQSSYNPNMPVRGLLYFARLYEGYVEEKGLNIYSSALQRLPTPQYVVFYNGAKREPDCQILSLKDAFFDEDDRQEACLDCTALMLNINYGHNQELLSECAKLREYAVFVAKVREYLSRKHDIRCAVDEAVEECIRAGVLKEFLAKHRAEVKGMILTSFDEKKYEQMIRKEEKELGREEGKKEGKKEEAWRYNQLILKLAADGKSELLTEAAADPGLMEKLFAEYQL